MSSRIRPTHRPPQTIKQAKAEYKKYGPRISSQEYRQQERNSELKRRAEKIKETEQRRKAALQRKRDKEQRGMEERQRMRMLGQRVKVSSSQNVLDGFMSAATKRTQPEGIVRSHTGDLAPNQGTELWDISEEEPWDDEIDDGALMTIAISKDIEEKQRHQQDETTYPANNISLVTTQIVPDLGVAWEDLFISNTQVEREIKDERIPKTINEPNLDIFLSLISTQDVTLSPADLEELGVGRGVTAGSGNQMPRALSKEFDRKLMPPPKKPFIRESRPRFTSLHS